MDYIVNIIGIGSTGENILKKVKEEDYNEISKKDNIFINKIHYQKIEKKDFNQKSWFNFIVYDNKDKDIVSFITNKLSNVEFLNIGISINGNDNIPCLKVLKTNLEEASDVILNMLQPILGLPGLVGYDIYDILEFLNTDSKYEIISFDDPKNNIESIISSFDKYNNMTIEPMPILSTIDHWTLAEQSAFLNKIWDLKCVDTSEVKWHLYFTGYIKKDLLTIIIKIK